MKNLSIIIVPFKVRDVLRDCLQTLFNGGLKSILTPKSSSWTTPAATERRK